ncbi:MAG: single-stranded-DNA-specific exonuclease RecJ [Candidatus Portnoybacteria bacterium CG23_combo_of_CG06-09_8_20_14_all_37_13]|uniref:Single-stranded-DNA-specific exonuclease RecJ n=1 Tax=Candidatus Portnoybacteria bacterium CG23_combo_of_CG06-09_8_20_14_all_37_13 TaxID=1974819 RepID=A0A2G9YD03_9BACT|nr:MAG: single-stranded-DNA-specific exonuclease RecJ [Candidatus Portnoybacteria bacterium CG23_combo_of_CG06-09_8_20_14_all_37_13]
MKKWILKDRTEENIIDQLLVNRGIKDADKFFNSKYEDLADPFLMKDVKKAVQRIKKAKKIAIFGDYDTDGVTGAIILKNLVESLNFKPVVYIPDRKKEGYGLNTKAIKELAKQNADLIITVDCGISDFAEVALANKLGIDVIITDHHAIPAKLPDAFAIINPKQNNCSYPFKQLAGVGVAFVLTRAFKLDFEKWLLDLVAIGTVADCMPLLNENRILTKFGLIVLEKTRNIGLKQIMPQKINAESIAFQIAPRLNAAGRMDHANTSYELLVSNSEKEIRSLAQKLEKNNQHRQRETEKILKEVREKINLDQKFIFAYNKNWPIGVIGLVAGKLCDKYHRPVVIIGQGAGSCRSIEAFNTIEALAQCSDYFIEFGGHAQAAGFKIEKNKIKILEKKLEKIINQKLKSEDLICHLEIDAELKSEDINFDLLNQIKLFEPFGQGNPKPRFLLKNAVINNMQCVGNGSQHLRMKLNSFKAIGFNCAGYASHLNINDRIDLIFELEQDDWQGFTNLQLRIIDLRRSDVS